jgi:glycosidase
MKKMLLFWVIGLCLWQTTQAQDPIQRVEPPFWWAGMYNPELQLMIYGEKVAELRPELDYPGVRIARTIRVENPNYLFVDLVMTEKVKPGKIAIRLSNAGGVVQTYPYELRERKKGSAMRQGFDNSDVMYLITPDRFVNGNPANDNVTGMREKADRRNKGGRHGGDIAGIIHSLDYIEDQGYTAIWVNPVLENDQPSYSYHGYSTTDYYKVDPRFGTNEEYVKLSQLAKERGIKMIMDMIVNHCGSEHWWMKDLPASNWVNFQQEYLDGNYVQTNHMKYTVQDPYVAESDLTGMSAGWFVKTMPDLNQHNPLMATYLIQNSIWWVEYAGLAGIRMDTYPYSFADFMEEWSCAVMNEYPNLNIVGEEWVGNPVLVAHWQRGKANPSGHASCLPSLMDFPVQETMARSLKDHGSLKQLYEMLAMDFLYPEPYNMVTFPDNHDMDRFFTQVNEDLDLFKMGVAFTLTTRGIPQIYYGTEVLMKNPGMPGDHGIIRSDFPGGWAGDKVNALTGEGLTEKQREAQAFIKKLNTWRKDKTVIHTGELTHYIPRDEVYVYFRYNDAEKVMVVLNKNRQPYALALDRFDEMLEGVTSGTDVLSGKSCALEGELELPARSVLVLELK